MATKKSRSGGKFNNNHTTVTPTAGEIADIANSCDAVYKISLGIIKSGLRTAGGQKRVKISKDGHHLLLDVRGNITHQQLYVYSKDPPRTIGHITKMAQAAGFLVNTANATQL